MEFQDWSTPWCNHYKCMIEGEYQITKIVKMQVRLKFSILEFKSLTLEVEKFWLMLEIQRLKLDF